MKYSFFIVCLCFISSVFAQKKEAYVIFNANGKKVSYAHLEKAVSKKKIVLFGELHNDPIAHWLQYELLCALYAQHSSALKAGSEMFERHQQECLNDFLQGKITAGVFKDTTKLWANFTTDYLPMLEFAKTNQIPWIATNITRKYASQLFKQGRASLDTLSDEEKKLMAPLDFPVDLTLSQYDNLLKGFSHAGENFVYAQAIKDATMGESIVKALQPSTVFYHLNGAYHTDFHQGIVWYIHYYGKIPYDDMITISTVNQASLKKLEKEYKGKADFIICTPETMTKTH